MFRRIINNCFLKCENKGDFIVIISNVNMIITEAGKFGVNTDIFETNVLNLSVVIGVLIYYGRVAFSI